MQGHSDTQALLSVRGYLHQTKRGGPRIIHARARCGKVSFPGSASGTLKDPPTNQ